MKNDKHKTKVIFIMEPGILENSDETCCACFPEIREGQNTFACYSHFGQHSTYHTGYIECNKLATLEQYKDLAAELESIGYNLEIITKLK